jgi:hypothetical protein
MAETLVSVEFSVRGKPPSKNHKSTRGHWATQHRLKKDWMWRFMRALDELDLDRPIGKTGKLLVYCEITEAKRTRLEMENVRPALAECLLDALWRDSMIVDGARIVGGWISHDSDAEVELVSVRKSDWVGVEQTKVRLAWAPTT